MEIASYESLPVLPPELTSEILLRLPVKTLLKMRCVSKSMLSLISSHQFIRNHLKLSANNQEFTYHRLLFRNFEFDNNSLTFYTYPLYPTKYEVPQHIPTELDFSCEDTFGDRYRILGSCDGLFCISRDFEDLFIWNPSTRKLKELPPSGINVPRTDSFDDISYGFGYTELQSDYKVVEIVGSQHNNSYDVSVYSLRSNSWKRIQEYPNIILWDHSGKFLNGKIHWIAGDRVGGVRFISSFNLADETFGNVALPDLNEYEFDWEIGSSGRNICLFCCEENKTDVWVMKEYEIVESWTKVFSIPSRDYEACPIFISQNNEILVHQSRSLVWYNSRHNTFMHPEFRIRCDAANNLGLYNESLVSPNFLEEPTDQ
ncbi:F-box/kelch-repeat protein At3g06240-like [Lycium ferocissimum]|uniref:F-box/kelch-repeat protein At3g06240-like n=1 Tax=Lycium ferocissimum TaxID=112874 RepID=UPI0028162D66|nr:F-box/kelch-repeat protein At3g06240-like [Lycium ferocissimum]